MLNPLWLRSLVYVVQYRGFQAAARALNISQPTVSQHVQRLEEELGTPLVTRSRRECTPTPAAGRLLPFAESLLRLEAQARAAVVRDTLRVGASSNVGIYLLQPYLHSYRQMASDHHYELQIDRNPAIAEKLRRGEIDVAVMEWFEPGEGLQVVCWRQEPLVLIAPPGDPLADQVSISRDQLAGLSLLGGEPGTGTGRLLARLFADGKPMPSVAMQLGSTEAVKEAVKAGLGLSLVMASAVEEEVRAGSLCAIPVDGAALQKQVFVSWRDTAFAAPGVKPFVDHLLAS